MKSIQALRERIAARAQEIRKLVDDNNAGWKPEHQSAYDTGMSEVADLKAQLKRMEDSQAALADDLVIERAAEAGAAQAGKGKGDKARELYAKWLRGGDKAISAAEWADIRNTTSTTTGAEGGFTVQTTVAASIVEALKSFGGMRAVSTVLQTSNGAAMSFPTSDGTAEEGEIIAENQPATDLDPSFGTVGLAAYKFSSKVVAIPIELLQDSQIGVEAFVNARLATRLGRVTNRLHTTGTGTNEPAGAVTRSTLGKTGANGQTITVTYDDLIDLVHSVDPEYRSAAGVRFMMHDSSLRNLRKLKDSQGRPIFLPGYDGLGGAMPDTLLGYQIAINQSMPVMAASAKSILFGDFGQYYVRDVMDITLFRFTDSAYVKKGQIGFLAWARSGGNLLDTGALKHYANSAT